MNDLTRVLVAQQSHRRMIDPRFMAKRVTPFVIHRVDMPDPKNPKLSEER